MGIQQAGAGRDTYTYIHIQIYPARMNKYSYLTGREGQAPVPNRQKQKGTHIQQAEADMYLKAESRGAHIHQVGRSSNSCLTDR
jgi:hypothetical protein